MLRNFNLLREAAKSHEIHLLTFNLRALLSTKREVEESTQEVGRLCKSIKVFDVPVDGSRIKWFMMLARNIFSLLPYSVERFKSKEMAAAIKERLSEEHFDLVEIGTLALIPYAELCDGVPKVLVHQNVESSLMFRRAQGTRNALARLYLYWQAWKMRRYEARMMPKFDMNVVVSDLDRAEFEEFCPEAIVSTVSNGTDVEYFVPKRKEEREEVVFTGGMTWYPNSEAVMFFCREVLPHIKRECPAVVVSIVGDAPPKDLIRMAAEDPSIRVHGMVEDIRDYVSCAAVYVVPIRIGGGTRLKILDAMAMGKAIVSATVGAEGLDVTPGKDILIADDATEFAARVVELLKDPEKRKRIGEAARKTVVEKYSWDVIAPSLESAYSRAVSGKRKGGS